MVCNNPVALQPYRALADRAAAAETWYVLSVFSSSKCSLLHNSNVFGSGIIHILYTVCAKILKKIIPAP